MPYDIERYRQGGDGLIQWVQENVLRWDGKSQRYIPCILGEHQKRTFREALSLTSTNPLTFKYRFIVLCRPRGDFKTFDVCLIIMWRFFNFPGERIVLGANSKNQSEFLLFDHISKTIRNSPRLLALVGEENVQRRAIEFKKPNGDVISSIQTSTTGSTLVSNATIVAFSELFKMRDPQIFTELSGSIRGVHNGMVLVDSTVAKRGHVLRRMWDEYRKGENPILFFDYYGHRYENPDITQAELDNYKKIFLPHEYRMFFENSWEDAGDSVFTKNQIRETYIWGVDGGVMNHDAIQAVLEEIAALETRLEQLASSGADAERRDIGDQIKALLKRFTWVDEVYKAPATLSDIVKLQTLFDTGFVITIGLDRAMPASEHGDRTILSTLARGHIAGKGFKGFESVPIYFLLSLKVIDDQDSDITIKNEIEEAHTEFGIIDKTALEDYQTTDIYAWCQRQGYESEMVSNTLSKQKAMFTELHTAIASGRFKAPVLEFSLTDGGGALPTSFLLRSYDAPWETPDIFRDELSAFEHIVTLKEGSMNYTEWFGSSDKNNQGGMKDDSVFSVGVSVYGGRDVTSAMVRGKMIYPSAIRNPSAPIGRW